ncbi:MAG: nucleotidyltransferase family protein [Candidatus Velthaea sp.]
MSQEKSIHSRDQLVAILRAHEVELRAAGIRALTVFGSVARGEDGPESDVDLSVRLDPRAHVGLFGFVALQLRLSDLVGRPVQLLPEPVKNPRLRVSLDRDGQRVL